MTDGARSQKADSQVTLTSPEPLSFSEEGCWGRRSSLEKRLSLLATILTILCLSLTIIVLVSNSQSGGLSRLDGRRVGRDTSGAHSVHRRFALVDAAEHHKSQDDDDHNAGSSSSSESRSSSSLEVGGDLANVSTSCQSPAREQQAVCMSPGCIATANTVLQHMDASVDPCQDFYQFACGSYLKNTIIADDRSSESQFRKVSVELRQKMRQLIESNKTEQDSHAVKLMKTYFNSCFNQEKIEEIGLSPLQDDLKKMGGWPVVEGDAWKSDNFSWQQAVFVNRKLGYSLNHIMSFSLGIDLKNSTWRYLYFGQASLGLPIKSLNKGLNDTNVKAYYDYMVEMAELLGANRSAAKQELKESLMFEIRLANISKDREDQRNYTEMYNVMRLDDIDNLFPGFNGVAYVNKLFAPVNIKVTGSERTNVGNPDFMRNVSRLLKETPSRVIANYMRWRAVASTPTYLSKQAQDIRFKFVSVIYGTKKRQDRWKECLSKSMGGFSLAAGSLYVKNYFKQDAREAALSMVKDVHGEFDVILDQIDWMDSKTKERAREKSRKIKYAIAYPEELLNDTAIDEDYIGLELSDDQFFKNAIDLGKFSQNFMMKKLREQIDKDDWKQHASAAVVNAFYSPLHNRIMFPAGILQGIFYGVDRPNYMNYGAIGYIIGHEITHGFDDSGRQFDSDGDVADWWQPETKKNFLQRTQCIIEQYGNITVEGTGMNINGKLTQGENIADNGGLKQARRAYSKYESRLSGREPSLPGLQQYNNDQMFWLSAANTWCDKRRVALSKRYLIMDPHSPPRSRVNVPFGNLAQFARDWKCDKGTPMNPNHRCEVW